MLRPAPPHLLGSKLHSILAATDSSWRRNMVQRRSYIGHAVHSQVDLRSVAVFVAGRETNLLSALQVALDTTAALGAGKTPFAAGAHARVRKLSRIRAGPP